MDAGTAIDMAGGFLETGITAGKDFVNTLPTHRQCTVYVTNECSTHTLRNPSVHTESGRCFSPFPPTIPPSATGDALFSKVKNTARGSAGIFTFELLNNSTKECTQKIAVLYKVPFDLNLKSNAYALGVFAAGTECNQALFREMSKETQTPTTFVRGKAKGPCLTYKNDTITIMATMSDCHQPVMKVQVSDAM